MSQLFSDHIGQNFRSRQRYILLTGLTDFEKPKLLLNKEKLWVSDISKEGGSACLAKCILGMRSG